MNRTDQNKKDLVKIDFMRKEAHAYQSPYAEELQMIERVESGDRNILADACAEFANENENRLSANPLKIKKYRFAVSAGLFVRAAVKAGMDPEEAYTYSDYIIQKADQCTGFDALKAKYREMVEFFVDEIEKHRDAAAGSRPVQAAVRYMHLHLHEPVTVADIAAHVGLTAAYFSSLFKKETGISPSQYLQRCRMEEAERLLSCTDLTYAEISSSLCFSSCSHFCQTFRKCTGMTPRTYRMQTGNG